MRCVSLARCRAHSLRTAAFLEKYFDIPGNVAEDKADEEDREADDEGPEGIEEEHHEGKAEYGQDESSQNHQRELPILHEPETNLKSLRY